MLRLQSDVARKFSNRHRFLGRLWQSRYRARVIDSQDFFRQAISYVHLNPVEAKIVSDPSDYKWCGHPEVLGLEETKLVDVPLVLSGFDDGGVGHPLESYPSWVRQVAELRWIGQGIHDLPWWRNAENLDEVASPHRHLVARTFDNRPIDQDRAGIEIEDFITFFELHSEHAINDLRSSLRRPEYVQARIEFATLATARYGLRSTDVARAIHNHPTSVARWISTGLRKQAEDEVFRERIDSLDRRISASPRNAF